MDVPVSPETSALLDEAATLSLRRGQRYVGVEHLFALLADKPQFLPRAVAEKYGSVLQTVARELERARWQGTLPPMSPEIFYTPRCAAAMSEAARLADRLNRSRPTAGHLLLAILADAHAAPSRLMDALAMNRGEFIEELREALASSRPASGASVAPTVPDDPARREEPSPQPERAPVRVSEGEAAPAEARRSVLDTLTRDLTEEARRGRIEPAIGREKETFEILQILARKNKNNAILVGEAGVGKTKIVEGLAVSAAKNEPGGLLGGWRIRELDVGALMSGTQYRGSFEEKLHALVDELKKQKKTILFIDEIHLIMGAGATEGGSLDMANLLKPALARGEIRCIGATTIAEYRKFIEKDPALERRFQMVRIEPLSESATYQLLLALRPSFERHHGIHIGRRALHAAIALTQRYMPNRQLPDKAIDVVDQACARYRLKALARKAGPIPDFDSSGEPMAEKVTPHDIRKVVSQVTGIPVEEITAEDRLLMGQLERKLRERIVGQDEAAAKVAATVKRARAGLADPNRPNAVMLFVGPSGVGKTQLAKELAERLFGSSDHLIAFDMSEYVESHSVSRLLGAPPGYVGHEEEGRLTSAVRNKPFSILLFDEIEKAHARVFDVLLPILEEGRLKDARGREVGFRNCILILTSNVGGELLQRSGGAAGRHELLEELRVHFRPEFINRIDEIVPFYPLLFEDVRSILKIFLKELRKRLREKGIDLKVYQGAYEYLAREGYSAEYGARELRRTVERLVANPIGDLILENRFVSGDVIGVLMDGEVLTFRKEPHAHADRKVS